MVQMLAQQKIPQNDHKKNLEYHRLCKDPGRQPCEQKASMRYPSSTKGLEKNEIRGKYKMSLTELIFWDQNFQNHPSPLPHISRI